MMQIGDGAVRLDAHDEPHMGQIVVGLAVAVGVVGVIPEYEIARRGIAHRVQESLVPQGKIESANAVAAVLRKLIRQGPLPRRRTPRAPLPCSPWDSAFR